MKQSSPRVKSSPDVPLLKISALIIGALTAAAIVVQVWLQGAGYFLTIIGTLK